MKAIEKTQWHEYRSRESLMNNRGFFTGRTRASFFSASVIKACFH